MLMKRNRRRIARRSITVGGWIIARRTSLLLAGALCSYVPARAHAQAASTWRLSAAAGAAMRDRHDYVVAQAWSPEILGSVETSIGAHSAVLVSASVAHFGNKLVVVTPNSVPSATPVATTSDSWNPLSQRESSLTTTQFALGYRVYRGVAHDGLFIGAAAGPGFLSTPGQHATRPLVTADLGFARRLSPSWIGFVQTSYAWMGWSPSNGPVRSPRWIATPIGGGVAFSP